MYCACSIPPISYVQAREPSNRFRGHTSRAYHSRTTLSRSSSLQRSHVARTKRPEHAARTASLRALGRAPAQVYGLSTTVFMRPSQYSGGWSGGQKAHSIGVLHGSAEVDLDGLEDEGNAPRAEEGISLGRPAKLLADGGYPTYTARLEEANCECIGRERRYIRYAGVNTYHI